MRQGAFEFFNFGGFVGLNHAAGKRGQFFAVDFLKQTTPGNDAATINGPRPVFKFVCCLLVVLQWYVVANIRES